MLDPKFIRENPDRLKEIIKNKGTNPEKADVDKWLALDKERTELIQNLESTNRRRNEIASELSKGNIKEELKTEGRELKEKEQALRDQIEKVELEWNEIGS